jgi:ribosome-associated heat shock protein Hsp15
MRIDRFLFFIRLAKSRTLAQALVDAGHIRVDGKRVAKPSEEVRDGSIIALRSTAKPASLKFSRSRRAAAPQRKPAPAIGKLTSKAPRPSERPKGASPI